MDDKEKLVALKYGMAFESVQKELQEKRKEVAEQLGVRGWLHSGFHAKEIIELELNSIKKLLDSKLEALLEVYYRKSVPWTDDDRIFLRSKIEELFNARLKVSQASLLEYLSFRGLRYPIQDFERMAKSIFSDINRRIEIIILGNRISFPGLPDLDIEQLLKMDESNQQEFKSTFQWDMKTQAKNEKLRYEVISTIAAFNNTDGGYLLIGVKDDKSIFGIEQDLSLLKHKKDRDGFALC